MEDEAVATTLLVKQETKEEDPESLSSMEINELLEGNLIPANFLQQFEQRIAKCGFMKVVGKKPNRKLVSCRFITASSVILTEEPYLYCLDVDYWDKLCYHCFSTLSTRRMYCSTCTRVAYCSEVCAKAGSILHNPECRVVVALSPPDRCLPLPPILQDLLLLIRWLISGEHYAVCLSYHDRLPKSINAQLKILTKFAQMTGKNLKKQVSRIITNAFTICSPIEEFRGQGLFLCAAMANHSCTPNTAIRWKIERNLPPKLQLVALENIPPETELLHSYVDLDYPLARRRDVLSEMYNFTCKCERCTNPPAVDLNFVKFPFEFNARNPESIEKYTLALAGRPHYSIRQRDKFLFLEALSSNRINEAIEYLQRLIQFDLTVYPRLHPQITFLYATYRGLLDLKEGEGQGDLRSLLDDGYQHLLPEPIKL